MYTGRGWLRSANATSSLNAHCLQLYRLSNGGPPPHVKTHSIFSAESLSKLVRAPIAVTATFGTRVSLPPCCPARTAPARTFVDRSVEVVAHRWRDGGRTSARNAPPMPARRPSRPPPGRTRWRHALLVLVIGLLIFFGIHLVPTQVGLRRGLVQRFGEGAYKGLFALVSVIGLALIIMGYAKLQGGPVGKNPEIWSPPFWLRHVSLLLMIPAIILLVAAYVPSRIRTIAKHPMLVAIKLWALAHLLANGDLASIVLFGSFLAYGVFDRISVKRREALGPLGARQGGLAGDVTVVIVGLAVYAALLFFAHAWLFGVAPVGSLST